MTQPISDLEMMQSPGAWYHNLVLPLKNYENRKKNGFPTFAVLRYHPGPDEFSLYLDGNIWKPKALLEATPDRTGLKTSDLKELTDEGWVVD